MVLVLILKFVKVDCCRAPGATRENGRSSIARSPPVYVIIFLIVCKLFLMSIGMPWVWCRVFVCLPAVAVWWCFSSLSALLLIIYLVVGVIQYIARACTR